MLAYVKLKRERKIEGEREREKRRVVFKRRLQLVVASTRRLSTLLFFIFCFTWTCSFCRLQYSTVMRGASNTTEFFIEIPVCDSSDLFIKSFWYVWNIYSSYRIVYVKVLFLPIFTALFFVLTIRLCHDISIVLSFVSFRCLRGEIWLNRVFLICEIFTHHARIPVQWSDLRSDWRPDQIATASYPPL